MDTACVPCPCPGSGAQFFCPDFVTLCRPGGLIQRNAPKLPGAEAAQPENKGKTAYFGAINNAKFKNKVVPGDVLTLEVEIIKEKGPVGVGKAVAKNQDGKITVMGEMTFMIG